MQSDSIFSNPDVSHIVEIPLILHKQQIVEKILQRVSLAKRQPKLDAWKKLVEKIKKKKGKKKLEIVIVGKYFGTGNYQLRDSYAALFDALDHASWNEQVELKTRWIDAERVEKEGVGIIGEADGLIVPIGWGERGAEGMIVAANHAREKKIPYLGLCYGMQLAAVAFARNILGYKDANTTENNSTTKDPVIHIIPQQKRLLKLRAYGGTMRLGGWNAYVDKASQTYQIYKKYKAFKDESKSLISERHRHRYEFNNKYVNDFEKHGFMISARSQKENLVEIIELSQKIHPFYVGTQGHPEYKSRPLKPHPLFIEFIKACEKQG